MTTNKSDKERLSDAFRQMRRHKIVAKQNWQCCQSCGWAAIDEKAPNVVFYHRQDSESFKDGRLRGKMHIAHRFAKESIGLLVCAILNQNGFYTIWDGTDTSRIAITNMTPELEALTQLKTADRVCKKDGHEWGWQLAARERIKKAEAQIGVCRS